MLRLTKKNEMNLDDYIHFGRATNLARSLVCRLGKVRDR
jgi:hypothetical protein